MDQVRSLIQTYLAVCSECFRRSPLLFLVLSVACFSAGLVVFAYSSSQHPVTSTITTVFSAFSSFGLAAVSAWFASERYVFVRHKGKKWLADVLDDVEDRFVDMPGVRWFKHVQPKSKDAMQWSNDVFKRASTSMHRLRSLTVGTFTTHHSETASSGTTILEDVVNGHNAGSPELMVAPGSPTLTETTRFSMDPEGSVAHGTVLGSEDQAASPPAGRKRFANLVRNVMMVHRTTNGMNSNHPKARRRSTTAPSGPRASAERVIMPKSSRVAGLVPKLRNMVPTQDIAAHAALVRHIQVSGDSAVAET